MRTANKSDLLLALQELLQTGTVGTQEEICAALNAQGFNVNQVKISRILNKLGAIKVNAGEQTAYLLPPEQMTIRLHDPIQQLIVSIKHNQSLIVIHTTPGSAQLIARFLDQKEALGILGTVAGDDTIFIAPENTQHINSLCQNIKKFLLAKSYE